MEKIQEFDKSINDGIYYVNDEMILTSQFKMIDSEDNYIGHITYKYNDNIFETILPYFTTSQKFNLRDKDYRETIKRLKEEISKNVGNGHMSCEVCEIEMVTIVKNQRGKKYSKRLLDNFFRNVKRKLYFLEVNASNDSDVNNENLEKLYSKFGFKKFQNLTKYILDKEKNEIIQANLETTIMFKKK